MKMKTQKSIPRVKKVIKSAIRSKKRRNISKRVSIRSKILPNRFKMRQNIPKRVSNRGIKSLENNFSVKATKNIISTPKIVIEKTPIVVKAEIVTIPKIVTKVTKPKIVD